MWDIYLAIVIISNKVRKVIFNIRWILKFILKSYKSLLGTTVCDDINDGGYDSVETAFVSVAVKHRYKERTFQAWDIQP